ncbi:MAG: hypothetical protein ACREJC_03820 [Tepidisphaeraceae bacterium]
MLTETEYRQELRSLANEAREEARSGDHGTGEQAREWLMEWVDETIDGHQFVINTAQAQALLAISSNDGAYVENYGTDGVVRDGCLNWGALAYAAMEADLMEEMDCLDGFDVNDPNPERDDDNYKCRDGDCHGECDTEPCGECPDDETESEA